MPRQKRTLLLLVAAIAVLGGGYAVLTLSAKQQEAAATDALILRKLDGSVTGLSYQSENGETLNLVAQDGVWQWADDEAFPLKPDSPKEMAELVASLAVTGKVSDTCDTPADYGLDTPDNTVTVTTDTGDTATYRVGDRNTHTGDYYLQMEGDAALYTVSSTFVTTFSANLYDMIQMETWLVLRADMIQNVLAQMPTSGWSFAVTQEERMVQASEAASDGSSETASASGSESVSAPAEPETETVYHYSMTADGGAFAVEETAAQQLLALISGIAYTDCANYKADEAALAQYGLDTPTATLTVRYSDPLSASEESEASDAAQDVTLHIGAEADGYYYVQTEGSTAVNRVNAELLAELLTLAPSSLATAE